MEDYWKRVQTGCFEPTRDEEDDCDGIESCRDTSEGQESAPAPSPLYQSSEDEVEVEVTYENDGFIQQSDGQENAPRGPFTHDQNKPFMKKSVPETNWK